MIPNEDSDQHHPQFVMMQPSQEQIQFHEMQIMELKNAIENFLDDLTADQCVTLCRTLQLIYSNPVYLHQIMGQLATLLRVVHKACGSCGDTKHSTMEHISATEGEVTNVIVDTGFLVGLSKDEQMRKLNVKSDIAATPTSTGPVEVEVFVCRNCDTAYPTLLDRAKTGNICMICQQNKIALQDHPDTALELGDLMTRYRVAESHTQEDGVFCLGCETEFPSLRHRINQGKECPVCIVAREQSDEGPPRTA